MPNTLTREYLDRSVYKPDIFKGKVAFITGGAGTICRVQAEALVLLGADVAIVGRNVQKTEKAAAEIAELRPGAKVIGIGGADVRKIQSVAEAVEKTVKALGKIDFVIAGAAGNFLSPLTSLSSNAFKTVVDIDLVGSFNTAKATFEELRKSQGQIIFVSATLHYHGLPFQAHAAAAKAGVDSLMRTIAVEFGPLGIRSNAIAPGAIGGTEGFDRLLPGDMQKRQIELTPLQRHGTTEDIANATVYLFSPAASYITSQVLVVDGGDCQTAGPESEMYPQAVIATGSSDNKL